MILTSSGLFPSAYPAICPSVILALHPLAYIHVDLLATEVNQMLRRLVLGWWHLEWFIASLFNSSMLLESSETCHHHCGGFKFARKSMYAYGYCGTKRLSCCFKHSSTMLACRLEYWHLHFPSDLQMHLGRQSNKAQILRPLPPMQTAK